MLKRIAVGVLSFVILDALWLGWLMKPFYREHLGPLAVTATDGSLVPIWAAIVPVYLLMSAGLAVFVVPRARESLSSVALYGAVFGWILFGVYDWTNYATLRNYSLTFTLVDMTWGGVTCAITSVAMAALGPKS